MGLGKETLGKKLMKKHYGLVHGIARCENCDWTAKSHKNAQATAAIHAKKYGHKVSGELGISFSYDYREEGATLKKQSKKVS